jgi:hypothetical protein
MSILLKILIKIYLLKLEGEHIKTLVKNNDPFEKILLKEAKKCDADKKLE